MTRARSGKLVGAGVAVATLATGGAAVAGGAASSAAATAHHQAASVAAGRLRPADHPGLPASHGGTTLTIGATAAAGNSASTTGTVLEVSSYDFVKSLASGLGSPSSTTGAVAPDTLVVTTSLAAQGELASLSGTTTGELVAHGEGAAALDATFSGLTLQQYEISSDNGGTVTLTFAFSGVSLAAATTPPSGSTGTTGGSGSAGTTSNGGSGSTGTSPTGGDGGSSSRGRS